MSLLMKLLFTILVIASATWSQVVDSDLILDDIEHDKYAEQPVFDVDTMSRNELSFRRESGKIFGSFVTTAGVVAHFGGFPVTYYGVINHDYKIIIGGLSAVILGIPIAGFGSEIAVNSAFAQKDANSINESNWSAYKEGQLFTYGGAALFIIGIAMIDDTDYENDDEEDDYGVAGVILVVGGTIATVMGLINSEISIFKFSNSVIDSYKSKMKTNFDANIMFVNKSGGKMIPGVQAVFRF